MKGAWANEEFNEMKPSFQLMRVNFIKTYSYFK